MTRSYEEASTTRRARLPAETRSDGRLRTDLPARGSGDGRGSSSASLRSRLAEKTGIDQATSAGSSVVRSSEREDAPSSRRRPRSGVAVDRQATTGIQSVAGVERRKVLVSDYAPRTRRDRECLQARTSRRTPPPAPGTCASGVCDACDADAPCCDADASRQRGS